MNPTLEQINILEKFYDSITLPKEFQFNKAIRYLDLPRFVQTNLQLLKSGQITGTNAKLRYEDLVDIMKKLQPAA